MPRARGRASLRIACVDGHLSRIGNVRMVLSKRPGERWKTTVAIVTNAANIDARSIVSIYERRWKIEVLFKELEQDLGLGVSCAPKLTPLDVIDFLWKKGRKLDEEAVQ